MQCVAIFFQEKMGNKKSKKKAREEPDNGDEFGAQWKHADAKKKADADAKEKADADATKQQEARGCARLSGS